MALIFDDAFEHEVFNDTAAERAVLLFDVWHPELKSRDCRHSGDVRGG